MWDLPGPEIKPMSPALAGGFLTTAPPGKSLSVVLICIYLMIEVEHHFTCVTATCISFFVNYPFSKVTLLVFSFLICKSSLYFRMIKPICDINCRKNFSLLMMLLLVLQHIKKCLYGLVYQSFPIASQIWVWVRIRFSLLSGDKGIYHHHPCLLLVLAWFIFFNYYYWR